DVLLEGKRIPDWQQLDTLADTVTSIEYYLERLAEGIEDNDAVLRIAEDSLASLGFPAGAEPTWDSASTSEAAEPAAAEPAEAPAKGDHQDLVDDEILDIFIEEAQEVLETIHNYFPRLRQNHDDRESLTEVRRAFHTLKGSGRLVGATSIAELAWSVENLLNRVIDQTVKPTDELFALVDDVIARIPELITDFRAGNADSDVGALIEHAEALATTRKTGPEAAASPTVAESGPVEEEPETAVDLGAPAEADAGSAEEDDLIDDEILEIFIEEAGEVMDTIREYLPMLTRQYDDRSALAEVRRAFHTLKGSGRMVGADAVGELAWSVENMLNRIIDGSVFMNDDIASLLQEVTTVLPDLVADFKQRRPASRDTSELQARATALANGEIPDARAMPVDQPEADSQTAEQAEPEEADSLVDPVLIEIFESETETHLQTLQAFLEEAGDKTTVAYTDNLSRALHTLKGSAHTASIEPIAKVITPLEKFVKDARAENLRADRDVLDLIADVCQFISQGLAQIRTRPHDDLPGTEAFLARLEQVAARHLGSRRAAGEEHESVGQADPKLVELFLNEGLDILLDADSVLDAWALDPADTERLDTLVHELRQLAGGAERTGITDVAELADILHQTYTSTREAETVPDQNFFQITREAHETLINMMDQVAAGLATRPDPSLVIELTALRDNGGKPPVDPYEEAFSGELEAIDESLDTELGYEQAPDLRQPEAQEPTDEPPVIDSDQLTREEAMDPELAEIFLEEAGDLVESTADTLHQWSDKPDSSELLRLLQRDLHTLKGGARLADITAIGDLAHELENLFEGLSEHRLQATGELQDLLFRCHDRLASMVDSLQAGETPRPAGDLIGEIQDTMGRATASRPVTSISDDSEAEEDALPLMELEESDDDSADASGLDPELAEIFLEEAGEIVHDTAEQLHQWQGNPDQPDLVKELQRQLHTLKGGARMAEIAPVADIAHEMETLFERIAEGRISATQTRIDLALRAHDQLAALVDAIADRGQCPAAPGLVEALKAACEDPIGLDEAELDEAEPEVPEVAQAEPETRLEPEPESAWEPQAEPAEAPESAPQEELAATDLSHLDPELVGIFLEEAYDLINSTGSALHAWSEEPDNRELAAQLQRDVHTLKGGARMAGVAAIGDLTHVLEDLFERVAEGRISASPAMMDLLFACHDRLAQMVEQVATQKPCPPADELVAEIQAVLTGAPVSASPAPAPAEPAETPQAPAADEDDLIGIFLDEGLEVQTAIEECLAQWREEPEELTGITQLQQELHTLKGGARLADLDAVADLAETWHDQLEPLIAGTGDQKQMLALSDRANSALKDMLVALEEGRKPSPATELIDAFQAANAGSADTEVAQAPAAEDQAPVDAEVLEIFLEEAGEILDQLEHLLSDWRKEPANSHFNQEAQRALHTLKGGARLAQQSRLGDQAHGLETRLIDLGGNEPDQATWQAITADYDAIVQEVEQVRQRFQGAPAPAKEAAPAAERAPAPKAPETKLPATRAEAPKPAPKPAAGKKQADKRQADAARNAQETIRVSAPLLDELVNLAGETSITRGRLETQTSEFGHTLDEMAATIERLREQLRRMDIETEAQILFRAEREHGPDYGDDFDPLEMDRYSSIQQLSRALSESASDLADLRETMSDRVRDTETLLVQQSRINTELQEGLMKTRMIPFASMVPRLRRIVRQ
ncbi:MAG: Hpt domain-containing protein, partial [Marinobacter sp.]|uniref:Hpt domain-containing protein n=1 Tax=Marinobacter sp. TaxID=50741 RepID=UPI00299CEFAB